MLSTIKEKLLSTRAEWVERITKKKKKKVNKLREPEILAKWTGNQLTDEVQGGKSLQIKLSHQGIYQSLLRI